MKYLIQSDSLYVLTTLIAEGIELCAVLYTAAVHSTMDNSVKPKILSYMLSSARH